MKEVTTEGVRVYKIMLFGGHAYEVRGLGARGKSKHFTQPRGSARAAYIDITCWLHHKYNKTLEDMDNG